MTPKLDQEKRLRRLNAIRTAAVHPPKTPQPAIPNATKEEEDQLVREFQKKQEEGGILTEDSVQETAGKPYAQTELPESRRGPISERETSSTNRVWKTHQMAETGTGDYDYWVADPTKLGEYEKYFGLKTPTGWRPTPVSDLLIKLSLSGSPNIIDPSRGALVPPKSHPYTIRYSLPDKISFLRKDVEDKIVAQAPAIFDFLDTVSPSLTRGRGKTSIHDKIRADTSLNLQNIGGIDYLIVSDTRHTIPIPLAQVGEEEQEQWGELGALIERTYPSLDFDIENYIQEIIKTAPHALKLGLKKAPPEKRKQMRDLIIRTVTGKIKQVLEQIDYDE